MNRYAEWGAMNFRDEKGRKTAGCWPMMTRPPCDSCNCIFCGWAFSTAFRGLQVCMFTAFYSFLKQAKLWESHHATPQPDPEADRLAGGGEDATLDFAHAQRLAAPFASRREAGPPSRLTKPIL